MIEQLHRIGELDERCLPIRPDRCVTDDDSSDDENETKKSSIEIVNRKVLDSNLHT